MAADANGGASPCVTDVRPVARVCARPGCGKDISRRHSTAQFCSDLCKRNPPAPVTVLCARAECDVTFSSQGGGKNAKQFCCDSCKRAVERRGAARRA